MKTRLPSIRWKRPQRYSSGSRYWDSADGVFRLHCSEVIDGIPLPTAWRLYQFKHGGWQRVAEGRSRARMERIARERSRDDET